MLVEDVLYGKFEIGEDALIDIIRSGPVQRLRGVSQDGLPPGTKTSFPHYSRYDHSIGVMLLLRQANAGTEEQIAGLIHDVSHTAFSHIIDWLLGDPADETYQDSVLSDYIKKSEISGILKRHGYDADEISNLEYNKRYRLLERDIPNLCADRIDYSLRDGNAMYKTDAMSIVRGLEVYKGEFVFRDRDVALRFGNNYMRCQANIWASNEARIRYYIISKALKRSIEHSIIRFEDLYRSEGEIIKMIKGSGDKEAIGMLEKGMGEFSIRPTSRGNVKLRKKLRYVDPKVRTGNGTKRLSELVPGYGRLIDEEKRRSKKAITIELEY